MARTCARKRRTPPAIATRGTGNEGSWFRGGLLMHPLHVVVDQSSPDGTALWILCISAIALIVAAATFGAVLYQIHLARLELQAVKQDLENNNQQMAEFRRRPNLSLAGSATLRANYPPPPISPFT
jgi:hypothetical protein